MRFFKSMFLIVIISLLYTSTTFANSALPPRLVVLLRNAPINTVVSVIDVDSNGNQNIIKGRYKQFNGVNYFVFARDSGSLLLVEHSTDSFIVEMPPETSRDWERRVNLDFKTRTASDGDHSIRSSIFVTLRVSFTLIIEGIIFWLYGFREKRSWLVFLAVNLTTQTALNIAINYTIDPFWSYSNAWLVIYEAIIILIEIFLFQWLISEKKPTLKFVIMANFLSWHFGGWILAMLPI